MAGDDLSDGSDTHGHTDSGLTRRMALSLLGVGAVGTAMAGVGAAGDGPANSGGGRDGRPWNQDIDAQGHSLQNLGALEVDHMYTAARDADVIVWKDTEGVFHADNHEETVASGEDVLEVTQAAVDSLTDGRDWMEKVAVVSPSTVGPADVDDSLDDYEYSDDVAGIELPSYTVLDIPAPMRIEETGDQTFVDPIKAADAEHIEIPNLRLVGNPRFGMFLRSVRNVRLGNIHIEMTDDEPRGNIGVRIDGFAYGRDEDDVIRCTDIQVDNVYVENSGGHAFETYAVDRIQIGKVLVNGTEAGAGVLLNETTDATVDAVGCKDIDPGGGYAGFRVANDTHDVTCDQVVVRGGARGIFGVSDSHNVTIGEVNISEMDVSGIFIEDNQNVAINGGVVKNCDGEAVRIHSRPDFGHDPTEGVTITNLRTYDDRDEDDREQSHGIHISGEQTSNVRIINCDVRGGGSGENENIRVDDDVSETVLVNNHGGGLETGTVTLEGGADPAAVVEGVSPFGTQRPSLRADPVEDGGTTFAYDQYFVWNGESDAWDLHLEWKHDPGENVDIQYVVDSPRAHLGALFDEEDDEDDDDGEEFDHNTDPGIVDSFESGDIDVYEGVTDSYEVTDEDPVAHGDYSLKGDGVSAGDTIISMDGLDRYPAAGTTFSAKIGYTEASPVMGLAFGAQDLGEFYFARVYNPDDDARLQLWSPSAEIGSADIEALEPGVFYELVIEWGDNEEFDITLTDPDGEELASFTAADNAGYTGGGVGTRSSALLDEIRILESNEE
ncbi:right-handed parallel beta-helix repeat-containing protein [Natronolimnobius sp. AArcel1]|uniref:right-handed parallel beta-helix repeat-containing protein n=1 Tax=Natronolimnobius sp. AArcel1 TaxID=1679093 RepID=UPI001F14DED7|nr:right-handed parallel beta-helix repeat-containing protein [Natronolimnobius sp. AArcel1]